mmetsp:Transcript_55092/g.159528  ORF Transcript_55092/g.159528 Transcript_55092/m.159528 type:complete len:270 (+) Transcript_55092:1025-1834(+)
MGCGVSNARIVVTMGPPIPANTIWSPSFNVPLTRMTSMVVPRPSMFLTSMTVHCNSSSISSLSAITSCVLFKAMYRRSGTPSPVNALVGTMDTWEVGSSFSQYSAQFKPRWFSCKMMSPRRLWNSSRTNCSCLSRASWMEVFGLSFHWYKQSTLFKATMKKHLRCFSISKDSTVWGSKPCMISITKIAMSHNEEPRTRKLLKASWPGVSMIMTPGTSMSKSGSTFFVCSISAISGKKVAPICCVIPPASPSCTLVRRILSNNFVLPVST